MEKQKNETVILFDTERSVVRAPRRAAALVLIVVGVLFLLVNLGVLSPDFIGQFFGSIGEFFGNLGAAIGRFFGGLGSGIGQFFGGLGRSIGDLWPLILIVIGGALLLRRGKPARTE